MLIWATHAKRLGKGPAYVAQLTGGPLRLLHVDIATVNRFDGAILRLSATQLPFT